METINQPNNPDGIYSVEFENCINFTGENIPETASITLEESGELKQGDLCLFNLKGMNKYGLAHLVEKSESGVILEYSERGKKRKSGLIETREVKALHKVRSYSINH